MPNSTNSYIAKRASVLTNPLTNDSIFLSADSASFSSFVGVPGDGSPGLSTLDGGVFSVKASGKVSAVSTSTLILTLYYSAAARTAITYNGTGVTSTGATITSASMTGPYKTNWYLNATFIWDYASLLLNGFFSSVTGPTPALGAAAVTTQLTAVDLSLPGAGFVMGAHLGSSNAASTVTLSNFSLEVL